MKLELIDSESCDSHQHRYLVKEFAETEGENGPVKALSNQYETCRCEVEGEITNIDLQIETLSQQKMSKQKVLAELVKATAESEAVEKE